MQFGIFTLTLFNADTFCDLQVLPKDVKALQCKSLADSFILKHHLIKSH